MSEFIRKDVMKPNDKDRFKAPNNRNNYETPRWLFNSLNEEFNFQYDLACNRENCRLDKGLYVEDYNSLEVDWHKLSSGWLYINPPYSPLRPWIEKAQLETRLGAKIVMLVPPIVTTRYFMQHLPNEIRFIVGRINFENNGIEVRGNMFDSCLLIYDGTESETSVKWITRDSLR